MTSRQGVQSAAEEGALVRNLGLGAVGTSGVNEAEEKPGCLRETVGSEKAILGQSPKAGPQ